MSFGLFSLETAASPAGRLYFVTTKLLLRDFPPSRNFQASPPVVNRSIDLEFLISKGKPGLLGRENQRLSEYENLLAAILD